MAMEALDDDDDINNNNGDEDSGSMVCSNHPFKPTTSTTNNVPNGICAFCLQDKLGKLVSSSFPIAIFPSSSSSSPSFRSDLTHPPSSSLSLSLSSSSSHHTTTLHHRNHSRRPRILPFLLTHKKKKQTKKESSSSSSASDLNKNMFLNRSKSTSATPRRVILNSNHPDFQVHDDFTPRKKGFWSFLYHTTKSTTKTTTTTTATVADTSSFSKERDLPTSKRSGDDDDVAAAEETKSSPVVAHALNGGASSALFERKVSRSRSVGCGSRSFSGDFFERISTGLGDCTLRRVESQREAKPKLAGDVAADVSIAGEHHHHHRVKCGGLFGGFIMTSSSSSSYWVTSAAAAAGLGSDPVLHNRNKSWGWALASPIRAFSKPQSSKDGKNTKGTTTTTTATTPNLSAMPSLLSVSS